MALFPIGVARRLLVELRAIRRALDRLADAQEFLAGQVHPTTDRAPYSFRSWTDAPPQTAPPPDLEEGAVALHHRRDSEVLLAAQSVADELRPLLGRDPTPEEVWKVLEERPEIAGRLT